MKRVVVVPYDPRWADAFIEASRAVASAMGGNLVAIHHIGSTAIPGIYAKPVIDMLAVVGDIAAVDGQTAQMNAIGYEGKGEFGIPTRRYFRRDDAAGMRTHQAHAFQQGSPHIERHLAFRDFMLAHQDLAIQYCDLKRRLAELYPNDINGYMDGKDAFIKEMQARALVWVAEGRGMPAI